MKRSRELEVINGFYLRSFYKFLNNKLTCKSGVGPSRLDSGQLATDNTTKATAFNDYFCGVFTHDDGLLSTFPMRVDKDTEPSTIRRPTPLRQLSLQYTILSYEGLIKLRVCTCVA